MNKTEQIDFSIHSGEWIVKEAQILLEKYHNSTDTEQNELLPKMKEMLGRLTFEGKELKKLK